MTSSTCLSVLSNIRCTDLARWQQVVLVIVSSVDVAIILKFLSVNWRHMRQFQWALVLESFIYFCLSLFDFLLEQHQGVGTPLYLFDAYDEAIGILTIFPVFLFMAGILILTYSDILPLTYRIDLRRPTLYGVMLLAPPVLVLNVVAGLVGITYVQSLTQPTTITPTYASYSDQFAPSLLGDLANIFLALFQLIVGGSCIYYVVRAGARGVGGGVIPGMRWVGIGLILGAAQSLMGLGMVAAGGFAFWLILARRIILQISRGALFIGFVHGTSPQQGFVLHPREPSTPQIQTPLQSSARRSNPILVHAQIYDNNANPRPMSFGLSDAIENIRRSRASDVRPSDTRPRDMQEKPNRPPLPTRLSSKFFANFSHTKSIPKVTSPKQGFTPFKSEDLELDVSELTHDHPWNKPGDRVTVEFPPVAIPRPTSEARAPVLHLRFSAFNMPSVTQLLSNMSPRAPGTSDGGTDLEMNANSASNRADQGSHQATQRASFAGIKNRLSQVFGGRPNEHRQSVNLGQGSSSRPVSMPIAPLAATMQSPQAPPRLSLGVGPVERGDWILIKKEEPKPNVQRQSDLLSVATAQWRRTRGSGGVHSYVPSSPDSLATPISVSGSEAGNIQAKAEIVQARSVTVSTQMSTLLYSPSMGGIVGAQIAQESSSPSPRNQLKLQLVSSGSESGSPSPSKRMSEILPVSSSSGHMASSGLARAMTMGTRPDDQHTGVLREGAPTAPNDYFSLRPETTGARVRIRTPTIISNAETRKSIPLEHGWTPPIAEEEVPARPRPLPPQPSSNPPVTPNGFDRFQHNYTQNLLLTDHDDGDRATIIPAYENHRRDTLVLADPLAMMNNSSRPPPIVPDARPMGGFGALL